MSEIRSKREKRGNKREEGEGEKRKRARDRR